MQEFIYIFASLLFTVFITAGGFMINPIIIRLERARLLFCIALLFLSAVPITFIATSNNDFNRLIVGIGSGVIIGVISYAMWLGIDSEIEDIEKRHRDE